MEQPPRFVAFVAVGLGCFDIVRAVAHTVFAGYAAGEIAQVDLNGPSGRDLLTLMVAFGASNFITGAALIILGLTNRTGALALLAVIPAAYLAAAAGRQYWGVDLTGQGVFPGFHIMRNYILICIATVGAGLAIWLRRRRAKRLAAS